MNSVCYNTNMEFDPIKFRNFIRDKFPEWRGKSRGTLKEYAEFLGRSQQVVSYWYNGKLKKRPDPESYGVLIEKYGVETYDALGLKRPSLEDALALLTSEEADSVIHALAEIKSSGLYNANANASSDEVEKIKDILVKHLGKYQETEH